MEKGGYRDVKEVQIVFSSDPNPNSTNFTAFKTSFIPSRRFAQTLTELVRSKKLSLLFKKEEVHLKLNDAVTLLGTRDAKNNTVVINWAQRNRS